MSALYKLFFISFFVLFTINSSAETGYISDKVYTYLHKGPSSQFKIIGSINAGSKVEILEKSDDGKYTRIKDSRGRKGWIITKFASTKPSLKQRYSELQLKLDKQIDINKTLENNSSTDEVDALNEKINQLNVDLATANEAIVLAKSQAEQEFLETKEKLTKDLQFAQSQLKGEEEDIKIKWLTHGGLLVLISFLIGIIVSALASKSKGQRKSNW